MTHYLMKSRRKRELRKDILRLQRWRSKQTLRTAASEPSSTSRDRDDFVRAPRGQGEDSLNFNPRNRTKRLDGKHFADMTPARTQGSDGERGRQGPQGRSSAVNAAVVFGPRHARELSEANTLSKNGTTQEELNEIERELDQFDWRQW